MREVAGIADQPDRLDSVVVAEAGREDAVREIRGGDQRAGLP